MPWTIVDITDQTGGFRPPQGFISPCAFATPGLTQYLAFRGSSDNHIHAIWNSIYPATSSWQIIDASMASGFPATVTPLTDPKGFWGVQNSVHLVFVGSDNHIYDIYAESYEGPWHWTDLTSAGTGTFVYPTASPWMTLGAYLWPNQNSQHVLYVGADKNIHKLSFDGQWRDQNISLSVVGGPPPAAAPHPVGFVWQSQGTEHIFYLGETDQHIHELYSSGAQWSHNDLNTASINQAAKAIGELPTCYMFDQQGTEHVVYAGQLPNSPAGTGVYELYYDGAWHTTDLYAAVNITGDQRHEYGAEGPVVGYLFQYEETQHVIVLGGGGASGGNHVLEFYWSGSWQFNDLTAATGAVPPDSQGRLTAFAWQDPFGNGSENVEAVVYVGVDGHIYELSYTSGSPA